MPDARFERRRAWHQSANELRDLLLHAVAPARHPRAADQEVEHEPRPGQEEDQEQPRARRGGWAPLRNVEERDDADDPFARGIERAPVGVRERGEDGGGGGHGGRGVARWYRAARAAAAVSARR